MQSSKHPVLKKTAPFDLALLQEFNLDVVYAFQGESSEQYTDENSQAIEMIIHYGLQHHDVYQAYLYAQTEILPKLSGEGLAKLSAGQLLEWLNHLHYIISLTLSKDSSLEGGCYATSQSTIWHQGTNVAQFIEFYFEKKIPDLEQVIDGMKAEGVEEDVARNFMKIFIRIAKDNSIKLHQEQQERLKKMLSSSRVNPEALKVHIIFEKFFQSWHDTTYSPEEKKIIAKVVKVCALPAQYPSDMQNFAEKLLNTWQKCDPKNLEQIVNLARSAYYGLTDIHPYFNANGRLATCLMNIILRSLGMPSIQLYLPEEAINPTSFYSRAIDNIDSAPEMLTQIIRTKLQSAIIKKDIQNHVLFEEVQARVQLALLLSELKNDFPVYDFNAHYYTMGLLRYSDTFEAYSKNYVSSDAASLSYFLHIFKEEEITLRTEAILKKPYQPLAPEFSTGRAKIHSITLARQLGFWSKETKELEAQISADLQGENLQIKALDL